VKIRFDRLIQQFVLRWYWIQQVLVTSIAAALAWQIGDRAFKNGGLVAAVVASLTVRSSLHKSTREGLGQIVGSTVGAGAALLSLHYFGSGLVTVGITVLISLVAARALHLGEVATINVPVTALIVLGPGLSETTASKRLLSTLIGAAIAIVLSTFAHPKTPAGRTIDRISSLTDRCAGLLAQMAEGLIEGYSLDEAGRWLARARLLVEEIPSIKNQVIEARVFAKWLPASRSANSEKLYLRSIAVEHMIVQTRATSRILYDLKLHGGVKTELAQGIGELLSTASYALTVSAEDFRFDPYGGVKDPLTSEIRASADELIGLALADHDEIASGQIARVLGAVSSTVIIADSLDQISPAIRKVPTPQTSKSQQVLAVSPIEQARTWQNRIYRLIPSKIRNFFERTFI
jgi:Aromatic acid exporter family member 1